MNKKSLALSIVAVFLFIGAAVACLFVMDFNLVSIILSAFVVLFALLVCIHCWLIANYERKHK